MKTSRPCSSPGPGLETTAPGHVLLNGPLNAPGRMLHIFHSSTSERTKHHAAMFCLLKPQLTVFSTPTNKAPVVSSVHPCGNVMRLSSSRTQSIFVAPSVSISIPRDLQQKETPAVF
ncbi:hypothetical protein ANANG_G00152570 [Anguilla anguilla]|uniref:Uncharacterized protein n=1 Tax=Anguilla anguilla TaxID=7936 RepID=A0A9D3RVX3_ANGAN|nr:hypothetical protein ANANG_G00152570 [Anguilla anguilla]